MADTKTSAESAAGNLTGAELIRGVQSGGMVKIRADALGHQFRGARVRMTSDDTAQNVTSLTAISFDVADFDTDSFWSAGSPTRLTIPAGLGIDYVELVGQVNVSSSTADTFFQVLVTHFNSSNTNLRSFGNSLVEMGNATRQLQATSGPINVSDGDYFQLRIREETDTSVTIEGDSESTYLTIKVIGMTP